MKAQKIKNLIWLDLEMTGLDPDTDEILEIATVITDTNLEVIAIGPEIAVYQPQEVLKKMNGWCVNQHTKSGLVNRVQESKINISEAEELTLEFIKQYAPDNSSPMCGNSICQDRRFLFRYMPKLENYFHYRNLDVSTLKTLATLWKPEVIKQVKKSNKHRAKDDILESIDELKLYREELLS